MNTATNEVPKDMLTRVWLAIDIDRDVMLALLDAENAAGIIDVGEFTMYSCLPDAWSNKRDRYGNPAPAEVQSSEDGDYYILVRPADDYWESAGLDAILERVRTDWASGVRQAIIDLRAEMRGELA